MELFTDFLTVIQLIEKLRNYIENEAVTKFFQAFLFKNIVLCKKLSTSIVLDKGSSFSDKLSQGKADGTIKSTICIV